MSDPYSWTDDDDAQDIIRELVEALTEFNDVWDQAVNSGVTAAEEHANANEGDE